jgi:hypothetical protein
MKRSIGTFIKTNTSRTIYKNTRTPTQIFTVEGKTMEEIWSLEHLEYLYDFIPDFFVRIWKF